MKHHPLTGFVLSGLLLIAAMAAGRSAAHGEVPSADGKIFVQPEDDEASRALGASLEFLGFLVKDGTWNGSGTLIRNDATAGAWILTARHCVEGAQELSFGFSQNCLYDVSNIIEADMSQVFMHEDWYSCDSAVVRLRVLPRKDDGSLITPVAFYTGPLAKGDQVLLAGYGRTGSLSEACYECGHTDGYARAARTVITLVSGLHGLSTTTNYELLLPGTAGPGDSGGLCAVENSGEILQAGVVVKASTLLTGVDMFAHSVPITSILAWINEHIDAGLAPTLELQTPVGGEYLQAYTLQPVLWTSTLVEGISLELWSGELFVRDIANPIPHTGKYDWIVPNDVPAAADYRLRMVTADGSHESWSGHFSIVNSRLLYQADMSTDPGWTYDGDLWAWGQPTGASSDGDSDPTAGVTGPYVVSYNLNGPYTNNMPLTEWATTPPIDCSRVTGTRLSFFRWLGVSANYLDQALIAISNDDQDWTVIWQNPGDVRLHGGSWDFCEYDISAWADGHENVRIRWGMGPTNESYVRCGWNIDDVVVYALAEVPLEGVEGDVAPRSEGDGQLLVNDWVQVGRFVAGLDTPEPGSEFQRADCAPLETAGDEQLLVNDWVQAGRYVAGLDAPQPAGGPEILDGN